MEKKWHKMREDKVSYKKEEEKMSYKREEGKVSYKMGEEFSNQLDWDIPGVQIRQETELGLGRRRSGRRWRKRCRKRRRISWRMYGAGFEACEAKR